ncbi:hypothetical protein RESH_00833 [Rhodopirellula europaea SH398]|uniref:Uncharacterized protein n=1 Tax=Rhodopirellula europaea SH398 TaxID=1263868 RepID=M5SLI1_9BACT|nr:hypothetical protein RESH_00833 [Rhodopirellula europaea SH398]
MIEGDLRLEADRAVDLVVYRMTTICRWASAPVGV